MSNDVLKFLRPGQLPAKIVADEVASLAEAYAADQSAGSMAEKIRGILGAIVSKCAICSEDAEGRFSLNTVADCPVDTCPLNGFGPSTFQAIRAKISYQKEHETSQ